MDKDRIYYLLDKDGIFYVMLVLQAQAEAFGVGRN
jgi:hypothetical protein